MSPLRQALADYLAVRRSLGYKLARAEKLLAQFITYLEDAGASTVTAADALAWATLPAGTPWWHAQRLSMVRAFAAHLRTTDPAAEIPPAGLIPARRPRATPYLYSPGEVTALIAAAVGLRSPLRAATYQTLIGLLAVTGMRVGEAIRLDRADFDAGAGVLTIRSSKFGKSRLVPLHPTATAALSGYLRLRDRLHPGPSDPAVFISPAGTRLLYCNVHATWRQLVRTAGLRPRSPHCRPRPLSRSGARFRCYHRPVSPDRSPNPPCQSPGNGLSTVPAVMRDSQVAMGRGSCYPGRRNGRPSRFRAGSTRPCPPRSPTAPWRRSGGGGAGPSSSGAVPAACGRASTR